jgi:hypothetical protein
MSTPVPCTAHEGCVITVMALVDCACTAAIEVIAAKIDATNGTAKRVVQYVVQCMEVSFAISR